MRRWIALLVFMAFTIVTNPVDGSGIQFRGANKALWQYKGSEVLLSGPAETGKTFVCCNKVHAFCCKYPGVQAVILRQVQADMVGSVLQTWEEVIAQALKVKAVKKHGGSSAKYYDYWNGSRVWIAGMDRPGKVLSSERDLVYFCQAEESTQNGYEYITTRCTGRAGNAPYHQILMDCNPGPPRHHLLDRVKAGHLKMLESRHEDNPTLFQNGEWTERGIETLRILDALTGVRYLRLRKGIWAGAEGIVYEEFDKSVHEIDSFPIPADWYRYMVVDWGYRDPMVVQWWAVNGEYAYMYREIYVTERLVDDVGRQAGELSKGEIIQSIFTDHDPDKQARFEKSFNEAAEMDIYCTNAIKDIDNGIQKVKRELKLDPDKKPYMAFFKDALVRTDKALLAAHAPIKTVDEFESYIWEKDREGRARKEKPVDKDNHGMDCVRYLAEELHKLRGGGEIYA